MFATFFEFFNIKRHPKHLWMIISLLPFLVILLGVGIEEGLSLDIPVGKNIRDYLFLLVAPVNLLGIGIYIYSVFKAYPRFFTSSSIFYKMILYIFLIATLVNSGWLLWEQVDAFACRKFLCGVIVLFPFGISVIITNLLLIYSLVLFGKIKKRELADPNPYL
jgi:hypothetical protein